MIEEVGNVRVDLRGEFDELGQHSLDRRAGQPILGETVRGDRFELPELAQSLADRHQPTLHRLNVEPRIAGHRASASS
jgi:hypothetical protein